MIYDIAVWRNSCMSLHVFSSRSKPKIMLWFRSFVRFARVVRSERRRINTITKIVD